jgi:hypothetical protein
MPQQHDRRSPERRAGDDLLLAAPGDGWVDVEQLKRHMMPHVMPGKAHRATAATRNDVYDEDGVLIQTHNTRRRDSLLVGQRRAAGRALQNAIRRNKWERSADGTKIRHRDHQPVNEPPIPTLEQLDALPQIPRINDRMPKPTDAKPARMERKRFTAKKPVDVHELCTTLVDEVLDAEHIPELIAWFTQYCHSKTETVPLRAVK